MFIVIFVAKIINLRNSHSIFLYKCYKKFKNDIFLLDLHKWPKIILKINNAVKIKYILYLFLNSINYEKKCSTPRPTRQKMQQQIHVIKAIN